MRVNPRILAELAPRRLVLAYGSGVFPMVEEGRLMWFSPDPRGLLPLDERLHIPRRLAWTVRRGMFACTVDRAFDAVVRLCARREEGTWISPEIRQAYGRLHALGLAHSVEAWPADAIGCGQPAGGLYGVSLGGAFFAESMFHRRTDAGKVAVAFLLRRLRDRGFRLCDVQWTTDNLRQFGAYDLPRAQYMALLAEVLRMSCRFEG